MANAKKCPNCGGVATMRRRAHRHEENVGGIRVKDATGMALVCETCGEWELSLDELTGYERRAARTVLMERPDAGGAVLKYARKALGVRQADLALLLGIAAETISRYENGHDAVPRSIELALAALLYDVEQGIVNLGERLETARSSHPPVPVELEVRKAC